MRNLSRFAVATCLAALAAASGNASILVTPGDGQPTALMFDKPGGDPSEKFDTLVKSETGVRAATADVDGDGFDDIIAAGTAGSTQVRVFSGNDKLRERDGTRGVIRDFGVETDARTGASVAAGDLNGDGLADIVIGAGAGDLPIVRVFDGRSGELFQNFLAFDKGFGSAVNVAVGDYGNDGTADLVVGLGAGGGTQVRIFDGKSLEVLADFAAFDKDFGGGEFTGGVTLATGRFDGAAALFVGAGAGGLPNVRVFSLDGLKLLADFLAFDKDFTGGVNVGFGQVDGRDSLFAGMATQGGELRVFAAGDGRSGRIDPSRGLGFGGSYEAFTPFGSDWTGGVSATGYEAVGQVPEPAIWFQLIAGFGVGGTALRIRRSRAALA